MDRNRPSQWSLHANVFVSTIVYKHKDVSNFCIFDLCGVNKANDGKFTVYHVCANIVVSLISDLHGTGTRGEHKKAALSEEQKTPTKSITAIVLV